jgi:hypothetical protein
MIQRFFSRPSITSLRQDFSRIRANEMHFIITAHPIFVLLLYLSYSLKLAEQVQKRSPTIPICFEISEHPDPIDRTIILDVTCLQDVNCSDIPHAK